MFKLGDKVRVVGNDDVNGFQHGYPKGVVGFITEFDQNGIGVTSEVYPYSQWLVASELEIAQ